MSDAPDQFLIEKNGLYYRPESRGYTGIKDEAGRYSFDDAAQIVGPNGPERPQDGLSMWAEADAPDYSPACYWDLKLRHQTRKECEAEAAARIRELEAKLDDLGAIKEKAHRQGYEQGKAAGDAFGAAIREHVERLEAKLAKAVDAMEVCVNNQPTGLYADHNPFYWTLQTTLTELKGNTDAPE